MANPIHVIIINPPLRYVALPDIGPEMSAVRGAREAREQAVAVGRCVTQQGLPLRVKPEEVQFQAGDFIAKSIL